MDSQKFSIEDLASDESFVRWVLANNREDEARWSQFAADHPELEHTMRKARALVLNISRTQERTHSTKELERIWENIAAETKPATPTRKRIGWKTWPVAAMLSAGLVATVFWLTRPASEVTNPTARVSSPGDTFITKVNEGQGSLTVALSDGSSVVLEPDSRVSYKEDMSKDSTREIVLEGEAFFNVTRDVNRPFLVRTDNIVTKVLGTSFRVKAYANQNDVWVAVSEGKVSVFSRKANGSINTTHEVKGVVLTTNQQVSYNRKEDAFSKSVVAAPAIIPQFDGVKTFTFRDANMEKVFKSLEDAYAIEIIYPREAMQDCFLTVTLGNESLFDKMSIICKTLGASYELIDGKIVVESKGCH